MCRSCSPPCASKAAGKRTRCHCEERSDEAIQLHKPSSIATARFVGLAMTASNKPGAGVALGFLFCARARAPEHPRMTIVPLGDSALVVALPGEAAAHALAAALEREPPPGATDIVAAFATVTVFYDRPRAEAAAQLHEKLAGLTAAVEGGASPPPRTVEIPVCYTGEHAPDLAAVAAHTGLSAAEVIALHAGAAYHVRAIGFAPGFPYLGGLPEKLATPRRATPRTHVPAGAVGIGGAQTGVYPLASPGGWNLIGRTPLRLFDPARTEPALLRAGDHVKFFSITPEKFVAWK